MNVFMWYSNDKMNMVDEESDPDEPEQPPNQPDISLDERR